MRKQYSKKEIRQFLSSYPYAESFMNKKSQVVEEDNKLFLDESVAFRKADDEWIPSLELFQKQKLPHPKVVVDKGTPPFIAKGADLMRPGIVRCEPFEKNSIIVIVDETHGFPLATGRALYDSETIMGMTDGKVIRTLHNLHSS